MSESEKSGSVYDRLGDLLSGVLEAGKIPQNNSNGGHSEKKVSFFYIPAEDADKEQKSGSGDFSFKKTEKAESGGKSQKAKPKIKLEDLIKAGIINEKIDGKNPEKAKKIPNQAEERALRLLGLTGSESLDDAKKAYREKLKVFHPDRNKENPLLQKIAREKTTAILDAWKILENFFS